MRLFFADSRRSFTLAAASDLEKSGYCSGAIFRSATSPSGNGRVKSTAAGGEFCVLAISFAAQPEITVDRNTTLTTTDAERYDRFDNTASRNVARIIGQIVAIASRQRGRVSGSFMLQ